MNTENRSATSRPWHALDTSEASRVLNANTAEGLASTEARQRLDRYGPNSLPKAPAPSAWDIALAILKDPMNLLLAEQNGVKAKWGQTRYLCYSLVQQNPVRENHTLGTVREHLVTDAPTNKRDPRSF